MICVLKQNPSGEISGWLIAADVPDARRRAQSIGDTALAGELYRMEFAPPQGKHKFGPGGAYTMLVD